MPVLMKLKELADFLFKVIFASTGRPVSCASDLFLWVNFYTCAAGVYINKWGLMCML